MSVTVTTPVYEGPFDLLLNLILKEEVELYEVSLSTIVDSFLVELERLEDLDLEATTEFLLIASILVELKTRRLLPGQNRADLDDEFSIVDSDECVDVALRPEKGCSMQVRFAPGELGSRTGVLEVTSNSKAKTNAIGLTGIAKAAVIAKPGKVRKLQAPKKKITSKKALVKWKKPKGKATITKYQTRIKKCQQKNNGQWNCKEPKWQKWRQKKPVANAKGWIKRDLTQLQPGTKYQVQVRAWSGDLKGPKSRIAFTTKRSGVPTKPGNG